MRLLVRASTEIQRGARALWCRHHALRAAVLLIVASFLPGCAARAPVRPPDVVRAKPPRAGLAADQEVYRREYLARRAYPDSVLDIQKRLEAYAALRAIRDSLHIPYTPPGRVLHPLSLAACYWTPAGPTNVPGRVTGMAITAQPSGEPRVIATTVGGVWRSSNGGRVWERISDQVGMKAGVYGAVAVNPADASEVFVAGGDPNLFWTSDLSPRTKIWRSNPGGPGFWRSGSGGDPSSWARADDGVLFNTLTVFRIVVSPNAPHPLFVATNEGVYFGQRTGIGAPITWSKLGGMDAETSDIAVDFDTVAPIDPPVIYAGVSKTTTAFGKGIWKHTGAPPGGVWAKKSDGISTQSGAITLALAPSDHRVLYARVAYQRCPNGSEQRLLGIYKTKSGGETAWGGACSQPWCNLVSSADGDYANLNDSGYDDPDDPNGPCDPYPGEWWYTSYNGAMAVHPADPNQVFLGGVGAWFTTDGGDTWTNIREGGGGTSLYPRLHEDQHALAFEPGNANMLWVGNDGGVWRSTDRSAASWHWEARAHGMSTTQFYEIASQDGAVTPLLGGTQDNGSVITHGNLTWHAQQTCDGAEVGLDAESNVTLYESCNGWLTVYQHAVQGVEGAWVDIPSCPSGPQGPDCPTCGPCTPCPPCVPCPSCPDGPDGPCASWPRPTSPFAVDRRNAGHVLAAGETFDGQTKMMTTHDGRCWTETNGLIPPEMEATCAAIAPELGISAASACKVFYVGMRKQTATGSTAEARIMHSVDAGANWSTVSSSDPSSPFVPVLSPNAIVVDDSDSQTAFAAFGGGGGGAGYVCVTRDGGATWTQLTGTFPHNLPGTPVTGVAIDPFNSNRIYASTADGVFKCDISFSNPITASWEPFSDQLPDAVDANSIGVHKPSGTLILGTFGYGAYQRVILPNVECPPVVLSVRDNVFDRALWPAPYGEPDPEHPIQVGSSRPDFYKADDTAAGRLYWWSSPDIRVEPLPGPSARPHDHVEFEQCPLECSQRITPCQIDCPPDALVDVPPEQNGHYRVYIQVTNRGWRAATNVRVTALWTEATTGLPLLPPDFWTTTFPSTGGCVALTPGGPWSFLDDTPSNRCKTIPRVSPGQPEVTWFDWDVPPNAPSHSCIMAIVESGQDPIPPAARASFDPAALVSQYRHIGLRNLHIIPGLNAFRSPPFRILPLALKDPFPFAPVATQDLVVSRAGLPSADTLEVLLPTTSGLTLTSVDSLPAQLAGPDRSAAADIGVDTTVVYRVRHPGGRIRGVGVMAGGTTRAGLRYRPAAGAPIRGASRFVVLAKRDTTVVGGDTYVIRPR
jgi:hypothetical protein